MILVGLMSTTGVWAQDNVATLEHLQGMIMIDRGDGYAIANTGDVIHPGDRVLVMEGSAGRVVDGDCVLHLGDNSLHTVGNQYPCRESGHSVKYIGPLYAAAIGIVKPKTRTEEIEKPPEPSTPDATTTSDTTGEGKVVEQAPDNKTKQGATAKGLSPRAIAIGAGIAAALAAIGGGGGGGNASTPDH